MSGRHIGWGDESIGAPDKSTKKIKSRKAAKKKCDLGCTNKSKVSRVWDLKDEDWQTLCKPCATGTWDKKPRYVSDQPAEYILAMAETLSVRDEDPGGPDFEVAEDDDYPEGPWGDDKTREVIKKARKKKVADPEPPPVEAVAEALGIDLASECPVCRSLEPCECEEEDRSFQRRVRFEEDVKKTARCPRCAAPLSSIFVPRPGARPPYRLPCFTSVWGCAVCHGPGIASVALNVGRARPRA